MTCVCVGGATAPSEGGDELLRGGAVDGHEAGRDEPVDRLQHLGDGGVLSSVRGNGGVFRCVRGNGGARSKKPAVETSQQTASGAWRSGVLSSLYFSEQEAGRRDEPADRLRRLAKWCVEFVIF